MKAIPTVLAGGAAGAPRSPGPTSPHCEEEAGGGSHRRKHLLCSRPLSRCWPACLPAETEPPPHSGPAVRACSHHRAAQLRPFGPRHALCEDSRRPGLWAEQEKAPAATCSWHHSPEVIRHARHVSWQEQDECGLRASQTRGIP